MGFNMTIQFKEEKTHEKINNKKMALVYKSQNMGSTIIITI